jgi:hypothetical protein
VWRISAHSDRQRSASQSFSSMKEPVRHRPASIQMRRRQPAAKKSAYAMFHDGLAGFRAEMVHDVHELPQGQPAVGRG